MAKTILATSTFALALMGALPVFAADPAPAAGEENRAKATAGAAPAKEEAPAVTVAPAKAAPETPSWEAGIATRRAGFAMGLTLTGSAGNITGYPNDVRKVGRAEYQTDTGAAFGGHGELWLGGALADWLVFGLGLGGSRLQGGGAVVQGITFIFHTELFPLFSLGGKWRELGLSFDTGAGSFSGELENKPSGAAGKLVAPLIDSGAASRIGAGIFYDGFRLGAKISTGPFIAFDYTWSATLSQPLVLVGLRTALYAKGKR